MTPAVADCRYRAPLSPRLRGILTILIFPGFVNTGEGSDAPFTQSGDTDPGRCKTGHGKPTVSRYKFLRSPGWALPPYRS